MTTGEPISPLSHEFVEPKSSTNPRELEEFEGDKEAPSASSEFELDGALLWLDFEFELCSIVESWSVSLFVLVSGFVEQ